MPLPAKSLAMARRNSRPALSGYPPVSSYPLSYCSIPADARYVKNRLLYCATDKEIFDALASSPQHLSEATLLELVRNGDFYSSFSDRMRLCSDIYPCSFFGFNDVAQIQAEFEKSTKGEKKTFKNLKTMLSLGEFRIIADQYQAQAEAEGVFPLKTLGQISLLSMWITKKSTSGRPG